LFAIPGIAALMIFILARPQEFIPLLQRVPFLHLFTVLAVLGWVIDVRLRRLQPIATPTLPWVIAFVLWCIVGTAVVAPDKLQQRMVELISLFALYGTIAHGVQRFRTFQLIAGVLAGTCMFITVVCLHQGLSPLQCVAGQESGEGDIEGLPDGRLCEIVDDCRGADAEPGMEYRCERVGMFGTFSTGERVRYRGELHDPNEVSLTIAAGALSLLIAFAMRTPKPLSVFIYGVSALAAFYTVYLTQSRGGLLAALLVPGVYVVRRWGLRAVIPAALLALPLLMAGGRSGADADLSTEMRYEAWATGLEMFKHSPVFGVGARLFGSHHFLTAHNTFVLTLAELGFPGMVMFVSIVYLSFKTLIVGLRELRDVPAASAATVWGMSLLASMAGVVFQINTLSFAYHSVMWIMFGLVGAWYSAVRYHRPEFRIRMTWTDLIIVVGACAAYALILLPIFLRYKGYM
jgi:O-antigen ligase